MAPKWEISNHITVTFLNNCDILAVLLYDFWWNQNYYIRWSYDIKHFKIWTENLLAYNNSKEKNDSTFRKAQNQEINAEFPI